MKKDLLQAFNHLQSKGKIGKEDADKLKSTARSLEHSVATKDYKKIHKYVSELARHLIRL